MPSLLDQINSQAPRRGVTVYSPGRRVPGTAAGSRAVPLNTRDLFAQIAAESKRQSPFQMGSAQHQQATETQSPWTGVAESIRQSDAYKPTADARKAAAEPDVPWWKQGLGMAFGNPVSQALLRPLEVLQIPQRAVTYGIESLDKALGMQTAKSDADKRSAFQKIFGDQPYGTGQLFDTGSKALDDILGFTGDVATDPFTYLTGGATRASDVVLERASKMEQLANAASKADTFHSAAAAAAAQGNVSDLSKVIERGNRLTTERNQLADELAAMDRKLTSGPARVKIEHGRGARAQLIGKLSEVRPQILEDLGGDVARAGERGFGAASPELRKALDIQNTYKFAGRDIPYTEPLARLMQRGSGAVRAALNEIPGRNVMSRGTKGAEEAFGKMILGKESDLDPLLAATQLGMKDVAKAGRAVQGRGYQVLRTLSQDLRKNNDENGIRNLLRQAEVDPTPNKINQFFKDMSGIYEKVTGVKVPEKFRLDRDTYVPHMLTREAKRYLRENGDNKAVDQFRRKAGFLKDDLLEGSGYLEKSRKLRPDVRGETKIVKIAGRDLALNDGSIEELNTQLAKIFPGFKGKFYQDDPISIGESYVSSIAKQAGRDLAVARYARSTNPHVTQVVGDLADALEQRNKVLSQQQPLLDVIRQGHRPGMAARVPAEAPVMPEQINDIPLNEYFADAPAKIQTNKMLDDLMNKGPEYVKLAKEDIKTSTERATSGLTGIRDTLKKGLQGTADEAKAAIGQYDTVLKTHAKTLEKLGKLTTNNLDEMVGTLSQVTLRRSELEQQLAEATANVVSAEVAKQRPELEKVLKSARLIEAAANRKLHEGPASVRAEAQKRLDILLAPVKAAEMSLNEAKANVEARIPGVEPAQVDKALNTFRRSLTNSKDFDEQMKVYEDAVAGTTQPPVPEVPSPTPPAPTELPPLRPVEGEVLPPVQPSVEAGPLPKREPPAKVKSKWEGNTNPNTGNTIWTSDHDGSEIWQVRNKARTVTGYRAFDRNGRSIGLFKTQKEARAAVDQTINDARAAAATREPYRGETIKLPKTRVSKKQAAAEAKTQAEREARTQEYEARKAARLAEEQTKRDEAAAARRAAQVPRPPNRANPQTFDPRGSLERTGKVRIPEGLRSPFDEAMAKRDALAARLQQATTDEERTKLQQQLNAADRSFTTGKWKSQREARDVIMQDIAHRQAIAADPEVLDATKQLEIQRRIADSKAESPVYVTKAGEAGPGMRTYDPNMGWGPGEQRKPLPVDVPREGKVIETPLPEPVPPAASDRSGSRMPRLPRRWSKDTVAGEFVRRENANRAEHAAEDARLLAKYNEDKDAHAFMQGRAAAQAKHDEATAADRAAMKAAAPEAAEPLATRVASSTTERAKVTEDHLADIQSMDEQIRTLQESQALLAKAEPHTSAIEEQMLENHRRIISLEKTKRESMLRLQRSARGEIGTPIESLAKTFPPKALEQLTRDQMNKMLDLQGRFDSLRADVERAGRTMSPNDVALNNNIKRMIKEAAGIRDEQNSVIGISPKMRARGNAKTMIAAGEARADVLAERKQAAMERLLSAHMPVNEEAQLSDMERQMLALEKARPMDPKWFGGDKDTIQAYVDTFAPTMPNPAKQMAERRVAEQAARARPGGAGFVEQARQAVEQMPPTVPNLPSTEHEAIGRLSQAEMSFNDSPAGRALQATAGQARGRQKVTSKLLEGENLAKQVEGDLDKLNHPELGPMIQMRSTLTDVEDALANKSKLTEIRDNANAQAKSMLNPKNPGKSVEKGQIIQSIRDVARANPKMLDDNLSSTEALLDSAGKTYDRVAGLRTSVKEVDKMLDRATRKKGLPDMMLTTVGGNWSMLYEATGAKRVAMQTGDYLVSKELHQMMTNLFDISKEPNKFWRAVETLTNVFKTYATLSPGFHVRNALSAVFMNLSDGVRLGTQIEGARLWQQYAKHGDPWLERQTPAIQEAFQAAWGSGAGGRFTEAGFASGGRRQFAEKALSNKVTRFSQRVGERVEGSVRLAMGLDSVRKGESVDQAVARITRIHFDYADVSKFDETAKRLVPFWTFLSRNLPLQLSQMWMRPKAYLTYEHFMNNMASENDAFTPKYWLDAGAWNTGLKVPDVPGAGGAQGLPIYLQPDFGFTRIGSDVADLQDTLRGKNASILSNFNPLFTAPLEFWLKKNLYTGQNYDDKSYTTQKGLLGKPIDILAGLLNQKNSSGQTSDAFTNFLMSVNPVADRAARVLPQLTGGGAYGNERQLESIARYIGAPVRTLTDKQKDSEFWRRFYEQQNAAAALRTAQREVASGG